MITQEDTIFVSGMNIDITEEEICQHFGAIGLIKVKRKKLFLQKIRFIMYFSKNSRTTNAPVNQKFGCTRTKRLV